MSVPDNRACALRPAAPWRLCRAEKATSDGLLETDWSANITVVDNIRAGETAGKDAVKQINKRLAHKNPNVVLHSLVVSSMVVWRRAAPPAWRRTRRRDLATAARGGALRCAE